MKITWFWIWKDSLRPAWQGPPLDWLLPGLRRRLSLRSCFSLERLVEAASVDALATTRPAWPDQGLDRRCPVPLRRQREALRSLAKPSTPRPKMDIRCPSKPVIALLPTHYSLSWRQALIIDFVNKTFGLRWTKRGIGLTPILIWKLQCL